MKINKIVGIVSPSHSPGYRHPSSLARSRRLSGVRTLEGCHHSATVLTLVEDIWGQMRGRRQRTRPVL